MKNDNMLLYEYPSGKEITSARREMALQATRQRKYKFRSLLVYISAALVFAVGLTADGVAPKIAICFLALIMALLNLFLSVHIAASFTNEHTRVTAEGFVHETHLLFKGKKRFEISFSQIQSSAQNDLGDLVIEMNNGETVTVPFKVTKTKLFLINNLSQQLKYPAKKYNVIEENDKDGKDWVDRL